MGCGLTKASPVAAFFEIKQRRDTAPLCVDDLKYKLLDDYKQITKRFGHPQYYKSNGYTLGVRVDGVDRYQTFYVGHSRLTNGKVTVKEHHMATCLEQDIIHEVLLLAKLSHPSLPRLQEIFITDWSVYTVMTKLEGTRLSHHYDFRPNHKNHFTLNDTRCVIKALVEAVDYCHSHNVVIRNLTPKNISAVKDSWGRFEVKICDFSLAVYNGCHDYVCDSHFFNWNQVPFMAPEALLGNVYSFPLDMWSVGVLLFMMCTYSLPFENHDDVALMRQITHATYTYPTNSSVPAQVKHLISELLQVSTTTRLTEKGALNNLWLNSVEEEEGETKEP